MNTLVPYGPGQVGQRVLDADRLIERWSEGRSKQTLRAYSNDLRHFSDWLGRFVGVSPTSTAVAVTTLLTKPQGEANEIVRAYRSAMTERGLSPSTINRRLSALRSLVALGKELGFVTFDLATRNVRAEAYRDTRGPEPDAMAALSRRHSLTRTRPSQRAMWRYSCSWATGGLCAAARSSNSTLSTLILGAAA